ncbi:hypothetical protein NpNSSI1_00000108 [Neofusicoccum parvum]|nr:hypothetical protein NpNSSI1_00000108 [Neofusicoccum parvum]
MPDQPDDHPASRKRTAIPSAPSSPTSPSAENENKRAKLLDPARSPTPKAPTDGTTTNSADQKPDAGSAAKEAVAAHQATVGTGEPGGIDTAAAVASEAPVEQAVEADSTAVADAVNEADAVPESRAFTYRTGIVDCPLSPGEMAELRAYYALDAERRAEERARALAEYENEGDDEEEEGGGRPASSPTAEG